MRKLLWILYQPYKWLIFFPILALATLLFGSLAVLFSVLINQKVGSYVGGMIWARLMGCLTPILVNVSGKENINKKQSYVIVVNHQSQYDIFILYGWLGIDFKWVMKQELRKIPGLGYGCQAIGHIFIDRSNPRQAARAIIEARKRIINGTSIIFFPEGTRGKQEGELGPFKSGAFKMAFDFGLPVLPVTIKGTNRILPAGTANLFPGRADLVIHKPLQLSEYSKSELNNLMEDAKQQIAAPL